VLSGAGVLSQRVARGLLAGLAVLFVVSLWVRIPTPPAHVRQGPASLGDGALFEAVIARVRTGQHYYDAMGTELRERSYPTASPFNWRTPALYLALSLVTPEIALLLLVAIGLSVLVLVAMHLSALRSSSTIIVAVTLSATACAVMVVPASRWLTESWCGMLIGLSMIAYMRRAFRLGAVVAVGALFVRELAAPFCVAAIVLAVRDGRRRELVVWLVGLAGFFVYYVAHVVHVRSHSPLMDSTQVMTWIRFGGLPFLLLMLKTNGLLLVAPKAILAAAAVLLGAAVFAPDLPHHVAGAVCAYTLFFLVVGQPFNGYWGYVPIFPWAVAMGYGTAGLSRLFRVALASTSETA
jgi:hypothetical protein